MKHKPTKFPDNCIKGLPNNSINSDGTIAGFVFDFKPNDSRDDEWLENSINWEDDDYAIAVTLNQRKDEKLQFPLGVATLPRRVIDKLNTLPTIKGRNLLSYERQSLKHNHYHGNILLKPDTETGTKRRILAVLALHLSQPIPNPNI